jgi:hypothetical protein
MPANTKASYTGHDTDYSINYFFRLDSVCLVTEELFADDITWPKRVTLTVSNLKNTTYIYRIQALNRNWTILTKGVKRDSRLIHWTLLYLIHKSVCMKESVIKNDTCPIIFPVESYMTELINRHYLNTSNRTFG